MVVLVLLLLPLLDYVIEAVHDKIPNLLVSKVNDLKLRWRTDVIRCLRIEFSHLIQGVCTLDS